MLFSLLAHNSDPADPIVLGWIKDQIDALVHLEPQTFVFTLGVLILAIPMIILAVYARQRYHRTGR